VHHIYCWFVSSFGASGVIPSGHGALQSINILSAMVISTSVGGFMSIFIHISAAGIFILMISLKCSSHVDLCFASLFMSLSSLS